MDEPPFQARVIQAVYRLRRLATPLRIALDIAAWTAAVALVVYLRFNLSFNQGTGSGLWKAFPLLMKRGVRLEEQPTDRRTITARELASSSHRG